METVLTGVWQLYGPPSWHEKWWDGQFDLGFSLEIASIEGTPHFYIRIPEKARDLFEEHFYAQYPDIEIFEVDDYTKKVPQNIPNDRWQVWGTDFTMVKESDCYPIRTYKDFETEHELTEEKRIDPMAALMEGLSKIGKDEQIWIQIKAKPFTGDNDDLNFFGRVKEAFTKAAGRKESPKPLSILASVSNILIGYPEIEESKKEDAYPEMKLTPGEKLKLAGLENKKGKPLYNCFIRYVYVAKKEKFNGGRIKIAMSYFNLFNNPEMGILVPFGKTITKVKKNWKDFFWFTERRLYPKKRKMFRNYVRRVNAFFPTSKKGEAFVLNTEELASLYHFPSRVSAPPSAIQRVESRKKEAPYNLPTEKEE